MLATQAVIPISTYSERSRIRASDMIRQRALERLYERRATVDELIDVLERYQQQGCEQTLAPCIEISAVQKCS